MKLSPPLLGLAVVLVLYVAGSVSVEPSPLFWALGTFGMNWAIAWWILNDRRAHGLPTYIDLGWFAFSVWPIVLPHHLLRTRGALGCLLGGVIVLVYFLVSIYPQLYMFWFSTL
jgi:hypothetical protein